jgi:hypothetical protein
MWTAANRENYSRKTTRYQSVSPQLRASSILALNIASLSHAP